MTKTCICHKNTKKTENNYRYLQISVYFCMSLLCKFLAMLTMLRVLKHTFEYTNDNVMTYLWDQNQEWHEWFRYGGTIFCLTCWFSDQITMMCDYLFGRNMPLQLLQGEFASGLRWEYTIVICGNQPMMKAHVFVHSCWQCWQVYIYIYYINMFQHIWGTCKFS